jgi:hypothetical protein
LLHLRIAIPIVEAVEGGFARIQRAARQGGILLARIGAGAGGMLLVLVFGRQGDEALSQVDAFPARNGDGGTVIQMARCRYGDAGRRLGRAAKIVAGIGV